MPHSGEITIRHCLHAGIGAMVMVAGLLAPSGAGAGDLGGEVSLSSQLMDRGLAVTPATPALQGAVSWTTPAGWSLGVSAGVELRSPDHVATGVARVARAWSLSENWQVQAGLLYYHYAGLRRANVYEPGVYFSYRDILTFGLSGDYVAGAGNHKMHPAADLNLHWPLAGDFSLSGGLGVAHYAVNYTPPGRESYRHAGYYYYGQLGLLWNHGPWRMELDRVAVDPGARRHLYQWVASPWLATISRSF